MLTRKQMREAIAEEAEQGRIFYVYGLARGDTEEVFYIGKGTNGRVFRHEQPCVKSQNVHKERVIQKHGVAGYLFFAAFENQDDAFDYEEQLIEEIGMDVLTNMVLGGGGPELEDVRERSRKQWTDPEFRARRLAAMQEPEYRERMSRVARKRWDDPEFRARMAQVNVGRVWSPEAIAARAEGLRRAWSDPERRKAHSERLVEVCSTPEMRAVKSRVSRERWDRMTDDERKAEIKARKERGARAEFKGKVSKASKRLWEEADEDKRRRMLQNLIEGKQRYIEERKARGEYKGPYVRKFDSKEEMLEARSRRQKEIGADPEEKKRRSERMKNYLARNQTVKEKLRAGRRAQAARIREQRKAYCEKFDITSPGKNYCNIDKDHFIAWIAENYPEANT